MIVCDTKTIAYNELKLTLSNRTWHGMPSLQVVNAVKPLSWDHMKCPQHPYFRGYLAYFSMCSWDNRQCPD